VAAASYHRIVPSTDSSPLHLVQSFANTAGTGPETDLLNTREQATTWLRSVGLLPAGTGLTNSEHAALLRLRDALRDVLVARAARREDAEAAGRLTKALAEGRLVVTVDPAATVRLASAARSIYPRAVAAIATAIADSAADGNWARLNLVAGS